MRADQDQSRESVRILGIACMTAAVVTGFLSGAWELKDPILTSGEVFAAAPALQRWAYGILQLLKSAGFMAGLYGFYAIATRRGPVLRAIMVLAAIGAAFFAAVWLVMAFTGRHTLLYVLGGLWYQWIAPLALGIAALRVRRVVAWKGVWLIAVGVLNAVIFPPLGPGMAQIVQGALWLPVGWFVYQASLGMEAQASPSSA
ncbi:MAG TPA: hypothetical protein VGG03_02575 [Thermoanaerobaculia bacterium]|jgi:hypothetical protein